MKIGIAISLYDKFDELDILVDIIRNNWKGDYLISVCSNFQDAAKHLEKLDIDSYVIGEDIKFTPDMDSMRKRVNITCRAFDCVRKSCTGANKLDCDYVMHLHTDAWPLDEKAFLKLVDEMKVKKKKFAVRGMGFTKYRSDCPLGHVDDMHFVYDVKFAKKIGLFDVNPLTMLPGRLSIHGVMSTLIVGKIHLNNVYFYDNHTDLRYWDGKLHDPIFNRGKPTMFDYKYRFLHVHLGSFPGDISNNLQAMYLKKYGMIKGKCIKKFLERYLIDEHVLFQKIRELEEKVDKKVRWRGFPVLGWGRFGRDYSRKNWYLGLSFNKKLRYWMIAMARNIWEGTFQKSFGVELAPDYSVWPESLDSFYTRNLDSSDYPDKNMVWYERKIDKIKKDPSAYKGFDIF